MTVRFDPYRSFFRLVLVLSLIPSAANAIFSQPSALIDAGPVKVNVDIEISEASKLLPEASVRSHVENRLNAAAIPILQGGGEQEMPSVVTASEREPAQIWVHLAARRISEPPGYLVSMEVSHLQALTLKRVHSLSIHGIGWHESRALIVPDDSDLLTATYTQLDSLIDDFVRDYQAANHPNASQ